MRLLQETRLVGGGWSPKRTLLLYKFPVHGRDSQYAVTRIPITAKLPICHAQRSLLPYQTNNFIKATEAKNKRIMLIDK